MSEVWKVGTRPNGSNRPHKVTFPLQLSIAKYESFPQNLYEGGEWADNPSKMERFSQNSGRDVLIQNNTTMRTIFCRKITLLLRTAKLLTVDQENRFTNVNPSGNDCEPRGH